MESAATTDQALLEAKRRKSAYQAKLRDHISEHDLPRRRDREQVMKPVKGRKAGPIQNIPLRSDGQPVTSRIELPDIL